MGMPAARVTDLHTCPMVTGLVPHVGGPILPPCAVNVLIGNLPAARVGDLALCAGGPDTIVKGSLGVFINGQPAARIGDLTVHGGVITTGLPSVLIGDTWGGAEGASGSGGSFNSQEQSNSCVVATSRNMIQAYTGLNIPESQLRAELREIMGDPNHDFETTPINPQYAVELLERHGLTPEVRRNQTLDQLQNAVSGGKPIMIGFPGHRVGLAGVEVDSTGNRTFVVMDPAPRYGGQPRRMTESEFAGQYNPNAIVIVP